MQTSTTPVQDGYTAGQRDRALSEGEATLLQCLQESADRGHFAVACDGKDRALAHSLDKRGFADWRGTNWGSSFWSITDAGSAGLAAHRAAHQPLNEMSRILDGQG